MRVNNNIKQMNLLLEENYSLLNKNNNLPEFDEEDAFTILCNIKILKSILNKLETDESKNNLIKQVKEFLDNVKDDSLKSELYDSFFKKKNNMNSFKELNKLKNNKNNSNNINRDVKNKTNNSKNELTNNKMLIEEEMYKNSKKLEEMTGKFTKTLEYDKNVVDKTKTDIERNTAATTKANKTLVEIEKMNTWGYLGKSVGIFIVMYIIIKIL
ncbi:hypothetical protein EHP00_1573 [Ecytonucleospora hepatopenaei]|uniref:Uncharacterized protein n=1 Tax=Ecytonucleospora hepatopenaei TaxID=646526 RepID=A0A1W0E6V0_9MICR|nr:hypothetical protein EHP00_1573 [Ecytonucleospora hepatopenaei]